MPFRRHAPRPPAPSRERLLAEEVLHLHALWRRGPSPSRHPPNPNPPTPTRGSGSSQTRGQQQMRKRRGVEGRNEPNSDTEWPLDPPPPPSASWPDAVAAQPPPSATAASCGAASRAQRGGLAAAEDFFSKHASDSSDSDEDTEEVFEFFLGVFEHDAALREYYERNWEAGEFLCMACVGRKKRKGNARRFRDCVGLVQHASAATRCGRHGAHRALAKAICRVLGWDMERLPSIVLDARDPLGQKFAKASAEEAKEDVQEGEKDSSRHEKKEEVHKEEIIKEAIEKEDAKEIDPLSCVDDSKNEDFSKEAVEAMLQVGQENSRDCTEIKTSESHNEENVTENKEEFAKKS